MTATEEAINKVAQTLSLDWNKLMEGVDSSVIVPLGANLPVFIRQLANRLTLSESCTGGCMFATTRALLPLLIRQLKIEVATKEWKAALQNVLSTRKTIEQVNPGITKFAGIDGALGPASDVYLGLLQEALVQGAATKHHSFLPEAGQVKMRGLAVSWGLRYMLAYAFEHGFPATEEGPDGERHRIAAPSIEELLRDVLAPLEEPS